MDEDPGSVWPLNGTRVHGTGRGQHHLYEDLLGLGNRTHLEPWGVDVRGVGGMVIGPGSYHPHGAYTVEKDAEVQPAPPELVEAMSRQPDLGMSHRIVESLDAFEAFDWIDDLCGQMSRTPVGQRNDRLNVLSGVIAGVWARVPEIERVGALDEGAVKERLLSSIPDDGDPVKSRGTIESGWEWGVERPIPGDGGFVSGGPALESLFDQTVELRHIRQAAQSRGMGPLALLHSVLGRVLAEVPPCVLLPPTVGSTAALNLVYALVGPPGGTKTSTVATSAEVLGLDANVTDREPGSGEGVVEFFMESVSVPDDSKPSGYRKERRAKVGERLVVTVDEASKLRALQRREGTSLMSTLRSASGTGAPLGELNATAERSRHVPGKTYRLVMFVGMQPEYSDVLLNSGEIAAGTPARVIWVNVTDYEVVPWRVRPEWPGVLEWTNPFPRDEMDFVDPEPVMIGVPQHVREWVLQWDEDRKAMMHRGESDPRTSHYALLRLKVAAALSLLHGQPSITDEWWDAAESLLETSYDVMEWCQSKIQQAAVTENKSRGRAAGLAKVAEAEVVTEHEEALKRVAKNLLAKIDGEKTWRELKKSVAYKDREYADSVRARLEASGKIVMETRKNKHGRSSEIVRLADD